MQCDGFKKNDHHLLRHLVPSWWHCLRRLWEGTTLLEEICHWGWTLKIQSLDPLIAGSMYPMNGQKWNVSAYCCSCLPPCLQYHYRLYFRNSKLRQTLLSLYCFVFFFVIVFYHSNKKQLIYAESRAVSITEMWVVGSAIPSGMQREEEMEKVGAVCSFCVDRTEDC